jgi:8-oxo-dGTP pyrophosphatase MutT (NUDIX family)
MPRACAVVRRDDELLVEEGVDVDAGERVFRPFGTSVRRDECADAAVERAFEEQLGVALAAVRPLGEFGDERVFDAGTAGRWLHQETGFTLYDPETGESTRLCWLHLDDFRKYGETLRPAGLLAELD